MFMMVNEMGSDRGQLLGVFQNYTGPERLNYTQRLSARYNGDAEHPRCPKQLLTRKRRKLDPGGILVSLLSARAATRSSCHDWTAQSYAFAEASLAVVRFVSEVGSMEACAVFPLGDGTITA
jgi:hypothetical protein